ncbi:hypothetical protein ACF9IK_27205 [Kitasatospora hibisci]|uniref:hypothetical protein n=1 Tax=Kitasatospora hibisci TaxID=3369522 RepID=UPI00375504A7
MVAVGRVVEVEIEVDAARDVHREGGAGGTRAARGGDHPQRDPEALAPGPLHPARQVGAGHAEERGDVEPRADPVEREGVAQFHLPGLPGRQRGRDRRPVVVQPALDGLDRFDPEAGAHGAGVADDQVYRDRPARLAEPPGRLAPRLHGGAQACPQVGPAPLAGAVDTEPLDAVGTGAAQAAEERHDLPPSTPVARWARFPPPGTRAAVLRNRRGRNCDRPVTDRLRSCHQRGQLVLL